MDDISKDFMLEHITLKPLPDFNKTKQDLHDIDRATSDLKTSMGNIDLKLESLSSDITGILSKIKTASIWEQITDVILLVGALGVAFLVIKGVSKYINRRRILQIYKAPVQETA